MDKIAFIGAGSFEFTRALVRDLLTFPRLRNLTLCLMDIDAERLKFTRRGVERLVQAFGASVRIETTLDRQQALRDADAVLTTILVGSTQIWRHDIEIPQKYGVDINVGDTRGPAGIFRFLRTFPVMLDIVRDMERLCPHAVLLNYTNPMAMLVSALSRASSITVVGLCHSVQRTAKMLARWLGASLEEMDYQVAGINHLAWFLTLRWRGEDAYPRLREVILSHPDIYNEEIARNETFLHLGYYPTESSGHHSEYVWWYRKRPDLIEKISQGTGWNPGEHAFILKRYLQREGTWKEEIRAELARPLKEQDLQRGDEYAAGILHALAGGGMFRFYGNVPNTHLIPNLPFGACVEVPIVVDRSGFHPLYVGELPPPVALLTRMNSEIEELAVQAALEGDPVKVFHAIAHDPLTAAVLSLEEIRRMVNELFAVHRPYLPQFTKHRVDLEDIGPHRYSIPSHR